MKNFTFLKPVFTAGMLILLAIIAIANLLSFKYLSKSVGTVWFIMIQEIAVLLAYMITRNFNNADTVIWPFAKKWWPSTSKEDDNV